MRVNLIPIKYNLDTNTSKQCQPLLKERTKPLDYLVLKYKKK